MSGIISFARLCFTRTQYESKYLAAIFSETYFLLSEHRWKSCMFEHTYHSVQLLFGLLADFIGSSRIWMLSDAHSGRWEAKEDYAHHVFQIRRESGSKLMKQVTINENLTQSLQDGMIISGMKHFMTHSTDLHSIWQFFIFRWSRVKKVSDSDDTRACINKQQTSE